jgi:holo-[acyl-carrier protein] synthase
MRQQKEIQKMLRREQMSELRPIGIGIDLVEVERIRLAHLRWKDKFLRRIFSANEIGHCFSRTNPYPSLAARFAAKEAAAKALGVGFGSELSFRSISVLSSGSWPKIHLSGSAEKRLGAIGGSELLITISHTRSHAIAQAVAVGAGRQR